MLNQVWTSITASTIYSSDVDLGKPLCESTDGLLVFGSMTRNNLWIREVGVPPMFEMNTARNANQKNSTGLSRLRLEGGQSVQLLRAPGARTLPTSPRT